MTTALELRLQAQAVQRAENEANKERIRLEKEATKERIRLEKEANKERIRLEKEANKERIRLENIANRRRNREEEKNLELLEEIDNTISNEQQYKFQPNIDGVEIYEEETYNLKNALYIAHNWNNLNVGKAYDAKTKTYKPDLVYKEQFLKFIKSCRVEDGQLKQTVKYTQASYRYGRFIARNIMSYQMISRTIRHTLANGCYRDLDIYNAHPIIYRQLCERLNLNTTYIDIYINEREEQLKQTIKMNPSRNREDAKRWFLSILNGGSGMELCPNRSIFMNSYKKEVDFNVVKIVEWFKTNEFIKYINSVQKSGKDYNKGGSILNHYMCDVENQLLNCIRTILYSRGIKAEVLVFDGCMIKQCAEIDELDLEQLSKQVYEKSGINARLVWKEMNEALEIPENTYDENDTLLRQVDWRMAKEGSDEDVANMIYDYIKTQLKWSNGSYYLYNQEKRLWIKTEEYNLYEQICKITSTAVKTALSYYRKKYDEDESNINLLRIKEWYPRLKERNSWMSKAKIDNFKSLLKPKVNDKEFYDKLDVGNSYEIPIKSGLVLNLKTLQVRDRIETDLYTDEAPSEYIKWDDISNDKQKLVEDYFSELFNGDKEVIKYMKILLGISLSNEHLRRIFFIPSDGKNGKSFLFKLISKISGYKSTTISEDVLQTGFNQKQFIGHILSLQKRSIGFKSECNPKKDWNYDLIKQITGDDSISGDIKNSNDYATIKNLHCKMYQAFNWANAPNVNKEDKAFWDRVVCLWFPHIYDTSDIDKSKKLTDNYLENSDIFFSYLAEGAKEYYENPSLINQYPEKIILQIRKFKCYTDTVFQWVEECCDKDDKRIKSSDLYENYRSYCNKNQIVCITLREFQLKLVKDEYVIVNKSNGNRYFRGLKIKDIIHDEDDEEELEDKNQDEAGLIYTCGETIINLTGLRN